MILFLIILNHVTVNPKRIQLPIASILHNLVIFLAIS